MVDHDKFERLNVQLLAISGDNTFSQQMFASSLQLNYPVLSDYPDLKIIDHYGILQRIGKADRPVAKGSYFLIDMQGIVRGKWMNPPGEVVPNETFLKARREIAP